MEEDLIVDGGDAVDHLEAETPQEPLKEEQPVPQEQAAEPPEEGEEETTEERPKKRSGVQRLKAHLQEEREARLQREQELLQLHEEMQRLKEPGKPVPPKESDYDDYEKFEAAKADHQEKLLDWKLNQHKRELQRQEEYRQAHVAEQTFRQKIGAAHEAHPDLEELLADARDAQIPITPSIHGFMQDSDVAGDVLYHLAKHPDEFKQITALSPLRQIAALARIEDRLTKKEEPKPTTKAPKPLAPVAASTAPVSASNDGLEVY